MKEVTKATKEVAQDKTKTAVTDVRKKIKVGENSIRALRRILTWNDAPKEFSEELSLSSDEFEQGTSCQLKETGLHTIWEKFKGYTFFQANRIAQNTAKSMLKKVVFLVIKETVTEYFGRIFTKIVYSNQLSKYSKRKPTRNDENSKQKKH